MNTKHKYKFIVMLGLACMSAFSFASPTEEACTAWMLYKEARGQPAKVQRAVLDVLNNRQYKSGDTACKELHKHGAYPYFRYGVKKVPINFLTQYREVAILPPVLPKEYIFFNNTKHSFGRDCRKIGKLYFCK